MLKVCSIIFLYFKFKLVKYFLRWRFFLELLGFQFRWLVWGLEVEKSYGNWQNQFSFKFANPLWIFCSVVKPMVKCFYCFIFIYQEHIPTRPWVSLKQTSVFAQIYISRPKRTVFQFNVDGELLARKYQHLIMGTILLLAN